MFSLTAFTTQTGKKSHLAQNILQTQFSCFRPVSPVHMLQHQLSCYSKSLFFIKAPSTEFLHYSHTYKQSQEPNLLCVLLQSSLLHRKRYVNSAWKQLLFDFKNHLIFTASFSTPVTMQLSLCKHSTKINTVLSCPQHTQLSLHISFVLHWLILMQIILYGLVGILISPTPESVLPH